MITLEGRLVISRALALPQWRVQRLLATPAAMAALQPALDATPADRRPAVEPVTADELTAAGGFHFHQGCLAYADRPAPTPWNELELIEPAAGDVAATRGVVVVLDDVRDPDNVGSIFRSALAFGVRAILLGPGCADPLYRKAIRTSMAATLSLPFAAAEPWPDLLDELRVQGFALVATTPDAQAEPIAEVAASLPRTRPIALLVGSEFAGVSAQALALADRRVRIPIAPGTDSLNVAAATAIALYALAV